MQLKESSSSSKQLQHGAGTLMTRSLGPSFDKSDSCSSKPAKNRVTFAKTVTDMDITRKQHQVQQGGGAAQKEFRSKPLIGWSTADVCDWLDSLFMPEYKPAFVQNEVDGFKLASITKGELESMGVIRVGHMMNIEKSLKRYLTA